jgi:hypothetical protein
MSKRLIVTVAPNKDNWDVKKGSQTVKTTTTKEPAIKAAKAIAKKEVLSQVVIKKQDGKIQTEYTYGKDPRKYKG